MLESCAMDECVTGEFDNDDYRLVYKDDVKLAHLHPGASAKGSLNLKSGNK